MTQPSLFRREVGMKAVCNSCKFEVSGVDNKQLDDNFRHHSMTFGHSGFYIIDYD